MFTAKEPCAAKVRIKKFSLKITIFH